MKKLMLIGKNRELEVNIQRLNTKRSIAMLIAICILSVMPVITALGSAVGVSSSDISLSDVTCSDVSSSTDSANDNVSGSDAQKETTSDGDADSEPNSEQLVSPFNSARVAIPSEPHIVMKTALPVGSTLSLDIFADALYGYDGYRPDLYIDWGDGNIIEYCSDGITKDGTTKGDTISIYCVDTDRNIDRILCSYNELTYLDVSNCPDLVDLECCTVISNVEGVVSTHRNYLTELDVSKNTKLKNLWCGGNKLTSLDVSNNTELSLLNCAGNQIASLDVSKNTKLIYLGCGSNQIASLDLSKNTELIFLGCENNSLSFVDFPSETETLNTFVYSPQGIVTIPETLEATAEFTALAAEYDVDGTKTVYTWYDASDDSVVTPTTAANGVFTFDESFVGKNLYCVMTNAKFPDLTLTTSEVTVGPNIPDQPQIILTTECELGSRFYIDARTSDESAQGNFFVDFGDGNIVEGESGVLVGDTVKIYCDAPITYFECYESCKVTSIDVSNCPALDTFYIDNNLLTEIDVSKNVNLTDLQCSSNNITTLDLSNNTKLRQLNCDENPISELDLSNNTALEVLYCQNTPLSQLDLSNNTGLLLLNCGNTQITELDLSNNVNLNYLWASNAKLQKLDISKCTIVEWIECNGNNLTQLDVGENSKVRYIDCSSNNLTELNIDGCTALGTLKCENNSLSFVDFPSGTETFNTFTYSPQGIVTIPDTLEATTGCTALAAEYDVDGTKTVYTWYYASDDSVATPTSSANGVFTFDSSFVGKSLYCVMTNAKFPDLTLTTSDVSVIEAEDDGRMDIMDPNGYIIDAVPEDGSSFKNDNGEAVKLGKVRLIVGNVAENNKKTVRKAIEEYNKMFKATDNNHAMYDISLEDDKGIKISKVGGRIYIGIKYPDNLGAECTDYDYKLYHIKKDGTVEEIAIEIKPNGIWFYADEFSPYVLTYTKKPQSSGGVNTGDVSGAGTASMLVNVMVIALFTASLALIRLRRSDEYALEGETLVYTDLLEKIKSVFKL